MATSNEKARNAASAERRADIVAAARELYEEQGLSKTSVQDITNRMGVARSLFYHYFPDKEAVTSAVLDDYVADSSRPLITGTRNGTRATSKAPFPAS